MKAKNIAILIVSIVLFIILLQNTQVVSLRLLFWKISMSRIILLPLIMLIGFSVGFIVGKKKKE